MAEVTDPIEMDDALPRIMRRPAPERKHLYVFGFVKDGRRVWLPQKFGTESAAIRQAEQYKRAHPEVVDVQVVEAT